MNFNAEEVFAMAEQIERNGQRFYERAAGFVTDAPVKKLLGDLAHWERGHEELFARLRAEVVGYQLVDPDGQAEAYLRAMAGSWIFDTDKHPSETMKGTESAREVLEIALGLEKESILFYVGLQEAMPPELGKDKLQAIITEEMAHVAWVTEQLQALAPR